MSVEDERPCFRLALNWYHGNCLSFAIIWLTGYLRVVSRMLCCLCGVMCNQKAWRSFPTHTGAPFVSITSFLPYGVRNTEGWQWAMGGAQEIQDVCIAALDWIMDYVLVQYMYPDTCSYMALYGVHARTYICIRQARRDDTQALGLGRRRKTNGRAGCALRWLVVL